MKTYGTGILRPSARPLEIHVDRNGEVWFCDIGVSGEGDLGAKGCLPASLNPQND